MTTPISSSTRTVGFWSAVLATVFSLAYVVAQIAEWLGWLGSRGGPESSSTVFGIVVLLTPSIASLWAVTFPGATWSLAVLFRRSARRSYSDAVLPQPPSPHGVMAASSQGVFGAEAPRELRDRSGEQYRGSGVRG